MRYHQITENSRAGVHCTPSVGEAEEWAIDQLSSLGWIITRITHTKAGNPKIHATLRGRDVELRITDQRKGPQYTDLAKRKIVYRTWCRHDQTLVLAWLRSLG